MEMPMRGGYPPPDTGTPAHGAPGPGDAVAPPTEQTLRRALDRLPHEQRLMLSLRYVEGLGVEELAEAFAVPPQRVTDALSAAMQSLARGVGSFDLRKGDPR